MFPFLKNINTKKVNKETKFYKIKYTLNLLPNTTYQNGVCTRANELMESLQESNDNNIYETKIVKDFYDFHWNMYAKHIHYFGALLHTIYLCLFVVYVNEVYLHRRYEHRVEMCWMMLICIIVPMFNDSL